MLTVLIVEDSPLNVESLYGFLSNYTELSVINTVGTVAEADAFIQQSSPNIVFLDLSLPDGNGVEILEKYQGRGIKFFVISAHLQQYLEDIIGKYAFAVLKKPFDFQLIAKHLIDVFQQTKSIESSENMELLLENMKFVKSTNQRYVIKSKEGFEVVKIHDILYCESDKNGSLFYLDGESESPECLKVPLITMDELEITLRDYGFIRIHKSFLVNQAYVKKYITSENKKKIILQNGIELSVPRERRKYFEQTFLQAFDTISNKR